MQLQIYILQSIKNRRQAAFQLAYRTMRSNKTNVDSIFGVSDWRILIQCVYFSNYFPLFPLMLIAVILFTIPIAGPWREVERKANTGQPGAST